MEKDVYYSIAEMEKTFWWYVGLHELVLKTLKKFYPQKNLNILDAGCGTGRMLELLNKNNNTLEGIDYSEDAVIISKRKGLLNVKNVNLNTWNANEDKYDIIICLDVIYHSGIKNDIDIIRKFYSAMNENSLLILNNPAFNILKRPHDIVVSTKRRYRKSALVKIIEAIGFDVDVATYRLPFLFIFISIKKLLDKIFSPAKMESDLVSLPNWLNNLMLIINRLENKLILSGISMPFGSSLFIVAKKQN